MNFVSRIAAKLVASTAIATVVFADTVADEFNNKLEDKRAEEELQKITEQRKHLGITEEGLSNLHKKVERAYANAPTKTRKTCRMSV